MPMPDEDGVVERASDQHGKAERLHKLLHGFTVPFPGASAEPVSFAEAKRFASQSRVALARDARSNTLRAVKPGEWEIWVTDAELLAALERESIAAGVQRVALWRISQEDPGIWRALGR